MEIAQKTPDEARAASLAGALKHPRYEVIPLPGVEEAVVRHVPKSIALTVTASPVKGLGATLDLSECLSKRGYSVAPHLSARLVRDEEHLAEVLERLREARIGGTFVMAGDAAKPVGEFEGAAELLAAMDRIGHGLEIGISGYPESHPIIPDYVTVRAMSEKSVYADYIVSQICFDAAVISGWIQKVRQRGVALPIHVGMPGVVSRQKLLRISAGIGLGDSARFLKKHRNRILRMFLPGGYKPDRLILGLEPTLTDPERGIQGLHIYTFNELEKTEAWRRAMLERITERVKTA